MNFKESERPWLIGGALAAVILAGAGWFGVIGPELANASTVRAQVGDTQTQNTILQSKTSKLKKQSEQLPALQQQLQAELAKLPIDAEYAQLTAQLNSQANTAGVSLGQLGFTTPTLVSGVAKAGDTYSIAVQVSATGPVASVQHFLRLIQQTGPRAALISNIALSSASGSATLSTSLTVFTTPMTQAQSSELQSELQAVTPK